MVNLVLGGHNIPVSLLVTQLLMLSAELILKMTLRSDDTGKKLLPRTSSGHKTVILIAYN